MLMVLYIIRLVREAESFCFLRGTRVKAKGGQPNGTGQLESGHLTMGHIGRI